MRRPLLISMLILFVGSASSVAQNRPYTPEAGSEERKEIMDALRVPVKRILKQDVIFKVDHLKVHGDSAFMFGSPRRLDGGRIDYSKTRFREDYEAGTFDDNISALLRRTKGTWKVIENVIGATDVPWVEWPKMHKAPRGIFKWG